MGGMHRAGAMMARAPEPAQPQRPVMKQPVMKQPVMNQPVANPTRPTRAAAASGDPFLARLQEAGGAPVSSMPTFGERIFGKRKVF